MSVKDVKAKLERLRSRLSAAEAGVKDTSTALAAAEIAGREANGALASLTALVFRRDVLSKEIERIERVDLPGAEQAEREKERQRQLALARRIHKNRIIAAAELDAAFAAADTAWKNYAATNDAYFGALRSAGAFRRQLLDDAQARRAGWASMPTLMRLLGAPTHLRRHALRCRDAESTLHAPDAPAGAQADEINNDDAGVQAP